MAIHSRITPQPSPRPDGGTEGGLLYNVRMAFSRWIVVFVAFALAASAHAHGYVLRAIPADRATLQRPPTRLQYFFSEALEPRFSEIHLRDATGAIIASGGVDPRNHSLLTMPAPANLPNGAYIVELRPAFASDGHVIAESRVFFVGEEVGGISGGRADDRAIPLEALWRAMLNLANFVFFGGSALYALVLLPAWGSPQYAAGLPPRVMRRMRIVVVGALLLAIAANIVALLQQSMVFFNADAGQVIERNLWQVVLIGSRFGDVWTFRLVLLLFSAALLFAAWFYRDLLPWLSAGLWRGLPWLGALFIGASMITSHAAGSLILPWLAIGVDWLHALAAAFWLGGLLTLTLILPIALNPLDAEGRQSALRAVLSRFSRLVAPLVALIIISGVYNALNFIAAPADIDSGYGRALGMKALLIAPALMMGGRMWLALRRGRPVSMRPLRMESALMLAILLAVAWLSATPVPEPALPAVEVETPRATQTVGDYQITVAILPGGPGVNTYDVVIEGAGQPVDDARIHWQLIDPARDKRSAWQLAEHVESGLYMAAGDDIDRAGIWRMLVDIESTDGTTTRAAFRWDIRADAAVVASLPPSALHLISLLGVAALLVYLAIPAARRLVAALHLTVASLVIAFAAVAVSAGVMVGGALMIAQQQREYELTLNPPPLVVNSELPDAESLARGADLFESSCPNWRENDHFDSLLRRMGSSRDEFLFAVVKDGWRELGKCADELSDDERWHIVNHLRAFETRNL